MFIWQKKLKYRFGLTGKTHKRRRVHINQRSCIFVKTLVVFLVFIVLFAYIFNSIGNRINPYLYDTAISNLNSNVLKECNNAVSEIISGDNITYDSLINKGADKDGNIKSLSINYKELNILKSELAENIQNRIDKITDVHVNVPVMAMVSNQFYSGFGIPVKIRVLTNESVKVEFCDEFVSAGINQTKHLIKIKVTTALGVNIPVRGDGEDIVTEIPIAESIIVGNVPNTYLNFK